MKPHAWKPGRLVVRWWWRMPLICVYCGRQSNEWTLPDKCAAR